MLFLLGILIYFLLVAFYYLITAVEAGKDAERHRDRLRAMAGDAELRALRAQLNPHFLFNSLNSISSLTGSDPPKAREMCVRLADFFRKSVGLGDKPSVTLSEEIELLSHYLAVEKIRLGERLRVELAVDSEVRKTELPPLLLQPLVENAVLHGIATLTEGGTLRIRAERLHGRLRVQVDNPYDPHAPARRGSGRGIENVRRRVAAHFGTDGRMTVDARDDRYSVVLSLPLERP
jgi:LytS/YehU family sensor histidine kinase